MHSMKLSRTGWLVLIFTAAGVILPAGVMAGKKDRPLQVAGPGKPSVAPFHTPKARKTPEPAGKKSPRAVPSPKESRRAAAPPARAPAEPPRKKASARPGKPTESAKPRAPAPAPLPKPEAITAAQALVEPRHELEQPAALAARTPVSPAPAAPESGPPAEIDEAAAWKTYQAESAAAWKKYQAKTINRAEYDAQIKAAFGTYETVAGKTRSGPSGFSDKGEALAGLKTWLQLEFCNSRAAWSSAQRRYGISAPTTGSGPAFTGLLDRYVRTVASDADEKRIESELREYSGRDIAEIDDRIDTIQRRLNTRDPQHAYAGSWCSRS
jgi:hypothetical protein